LLLERLEDRTLFDAAALISLDPIEPLSADCQTDDCRVAAAPSDSVAQQLVFVDLQIDGSQELLDNLIGSRSDQFEIFYLNETASGIHQITDILSQRQDIEAVHILSHGEGGSIQLGADLLDLGSAQQYAADLQSWQHALTTSADILIYGCELGSTTDGQELLNELHVLTQADIAASDDLTGTAALGGDWQLEVTRGDINLDLVLTPISTGWSGLLAVEATRDIVTIQNATSSSAGTITLGDNAQLIEVTSSNTPERVVQMLQRVWSFNETADVGAATYVFDITGIGGILGTKATDFALIRSTQVDLVAGTTDVLLASGFDSANQLVYFHGIDLNDGEFFALATKSETNSFSIAPTTTTLEDTPVNIGVTVDPALTSGGTLQDIIATDIGYRASSAGATPTDFVIPAGTVGIRITGYSTRDGNTSANDTQNDDYQTLYATIDLTTNTSDGFNAYIVDRGVSRSDQFAWEDSPLGASILTGGGTVSGDTSNGIDPTFQIVDGVLQIIENHPLQTAYHVEFLTTVETSSNYLGVVSEVRDQGDTTDIVIPIDPNADFIVINEADAATDGGDYRVEYKGFGRIVLDLNTLRASGTLVAERGENLDRNTAYSFANYDASNAAVGSIQSSGATIVGDTFDTVNSNNDLQFYINASGDLVIRREAGFAGVFNSLFSVEFYERLTIGSQANALATSFDRQFFVADVTGPVHTLTLDIPDGAVLGIMNLSMSNEETDDVNENMGAGYAIIDLANGVTSGSLYNIRVGGTVDFVAWSEVMFGTEFFEANSDADPNSSMESNHTLISEFVDEWSGNASLNLVTNPDGSQTVTYTSYNNQTAASFKNYWTAAQVQWYGVQPFELSGYPANGAFDKGQLNPSSGNWEVSIEDIAAGLTYIPGEHYSGFDPIDISFRLGQENESTTVIVQAVIDPITFSVDSVTTPEETPVSISAGVDPTYIDTDGSETLTSIELGNFAIGHGITDGTLTFIATASSSDVDITGWDRTNLTYLPALDAVGTFDLDVTAAFQDVGGGVTDSSSITETLSIVISNVNDDPSAKDDFYITAEGEVLTSVLGTDGLLDNDSDPDTADTLTATILPIIGPANGSLVINTDGTFTYTPSGGFVGNDSFVYEVTDGNGGTAQATARIIVAPPILCDLTDVWDLSGAPHAEADLIGIDVTTSVAGGATLGGYTNEFFNNIPAFADMMAGGHESLGVNFTWDSTPEPGAASGGTGILTFTFDEAIVNPEFNLDRLGDMAGGVSNSALLTLLTPGLTLERLSGPLHFEVDTLAGTIQRTPNQILAGGATEQSSIDPSLGSAAGSVRIVGSVTTVSFQLEGVGPEGLGFDEFELSWCVNAAPNAVDDPATTPEETTVTIDVTGNDSDSLGELFALVATTEPTNGSIVVNPDSTIDYAPDPDFYGIDTFTYTIQDANEGAATATVTVTVTNTQDDPTAFPDSDATDEDTPVTIDVLANDVDPDPDTLTVTSASAPNGSVTINPDGTITYLPSPHWSGTDTITYSISDGAGGTDTTTVTVNVVAVADAPTSTSFSRLTTEDTEYVFTLADFAFNDDDPGDMFTEFRIDSLPAAGTLSYDGTDLTTAPLTIVPADIAAGRLVFISEPNASGFPYASFDFSVGDGVLFSTTPNTVTFNVLATNDPPTTGNHRVDLLEDGSVTFALADFPYADPELDPIFELRIDTLPASGTLWLGATAVTPGQLLTIASITGGQLSYTPVADENGTGYTSFTFSPSDGTVFSESPGVMTIDVTPVNDAPTLGSIADASFNENTVNANSQIIDATAGLPTDIDSPDFNGGSLTITYSTGGGSEDQLSIFDQGSGAGEIGFDGTTLTFGGIAFGTVVPATNGNNGNDLIISFTTGQATPNAVQALLRNLTYANTSNAPTTSRTIAATLIDGDGTANLGTDTSASELATITVTDENDTVRITASDPAASEPADHGEFTVSLTGATAEDIVVNYAVAGTAATGDYTALSGSVTILAGTNSATIDVLVTDDNLVEPTETVIATLTGASPNIAIDALNDSASLTIGDDDTAEVTIATTTNGAEPSTNGQFTVSLSNLSSTDTVVSYTVTGDAAAGTDYSTLSGSVTILAGQATATIDVAVLDDSLLEDNELVTVTLDAITSGDPQISLGAANVASVTIADNDTAEVTITANDPVAAEPSNPGQFTVALSQLSDTDTVISYGVSGTAVAGSDYTALSGTVTISAGSLSATIDVSVLDLPALEADETVIVTLTSITSGDADISIGSPASATVTISDDDAAELSITANDPAAGEPSNDGQFTVTQSATSLVDTVVSYVVTGTATDGTDFTSLPGSVTIAAGTTTALIDINVLNDNIVELTETLTITLDSITAGASALFIGASAADSVTITDEDSAEVTLVANDPTAAEPGDDGQLTVSLSSASGTDTTISYTVAGSATPGNDFTALSGTVTILAGDTSAVIDISIVDTALLESSETVVVALASITAGDADISLSATTNSGTVTIADDDAATVTIAATTPASEPATAGQFTVTLSSPADTDTTVAYTVTGDAAAGSDYTALSGLVTILAGNTTATIDVAVLDDGVLESVENVTVTLDSITGGDADISIGTTNVATVTIADDDSATISLVANDAAAAEPTNDGQFTLSLSQVSNTDTVVAYSVGGDATSGSDFTPLSGSVTILAGSTTATVDVAVLDDSLLENNETVTLTLTSITSGHPNIAIDTLSNSATVTIADNDSAEVTIAANDPAAGEPANPGQFTVSLSNLSDTDTTISYTVAGDATAGTDYTTLSGSVTILAGQAAATIDIGLLDDSLLEDNESVTITLDSITAGDADISIGAANAATVTIADDDTADVTITATTAAAEPATDGQFTVALSNLSDTDTTISYTVSGDATAGSDYTTLSGSVTILAGQATATIDVNVLDDSLLEDNESVTVTLITVTGGDTDVSIGAANAATVTIADDDSAELSIVANDPAASEPANNGQFTVTLASVSDTDTVVSYTVTGDATSGSDFTPLTGSVTIVAGNATATIDLTTLDDSLIEDDETVTVTLNAVTAGDADISIGAANAATVTMTDNDSAEVTIIANDPVASEPTNPGQFAVSLSNVSDTDTIVSYTVSGDATAGADFTPLSGTVTILAGDGSATIDLTVIDDSLIEDNETVTVTLNTVTAGDADISIGATNAATVTIADDDTAEVTIAASDPAAAEPANPGQFTVSLSNLSDTDTTISYTVSGDATAGTDYTTLSGTVTILAGDSTATIDLSVLDDALLEDNENVTVTLNAITAGDADVSIGAANAATVSISDDDSAEVTIVANDATASEPVNHGQFTVSLSNVSDSDTTVSYTVSGDATSGSDFAPLTGTVTIGAGNTTATIDLTTLDDSLLEDDENVTVTLNAVTAGDADISIGTANAATVTIADDETAQITIVATDAAASEPTNDGQFTVTISSPSDSDTTVSYTVTGDATAGTDFTALTGTVTILAGDSTATIDLTVLDDSLLEESETVTVTLNTVTTGDADIAIGVSNTATITIADDDTAQVTIVATDPTAAEPTNDGQFTVSLSHASDTDTTVSYTVTGDATSGDDFTPLAGAVTILAGNTAATIDLTVVDDSLIEDNETVTVTLNTVTAGDADVSIGATNAATVTIADDDAAEVTIAANDPAAAEPTNNGQYTVTLSNISDTDTVISYAVSGDATPGTDFTSLTGTVTILAGDATATIDLTVLDDALLEDNETVTVTLNSVTAGDADVSIGATNAATVTIADDDMAEVIIAANDPVAAEPTDNGQYTVTLSSISDTDTVISYTVTGDATAGTDFTPLTGSVTIVAGDTTATIDLATLNDSLLEDDENVIVTLNAIIAGDANISIGAANAATVTIADDDAAEVTIAANDATAAEPANNGQFTVSLSNVSDTDTVVSYTVNGDAIAGTDYTTLAGSVTLLAGDNSATIDLSVLDDSLLEDNETVTITLNSVTAGDTDISIGAAAAATATIADNDAAEVTIAANDPTAAEPANHGQFTVSLSNISDSDTTVSYTLGGDAVAGSDFATLSGSVTIIAGSSSATIDLSVLDDSLLEDDETVTITLSAITNGDADISIGAANAATVTISDNDTADVTIAANDPTAGEPANPGQFTVTLSSVSDTDTMVGYSVSGDATAGSDFTPLPGTITILAGETTALIDVAILDDSLLEDNETITVTLNSITAGDANISVGATNAASVTITDNDTAEVSITASDPAASEPADGGQWTISLSNRSDTDTVVSYNVSGTASAGSDFTALSGSVTILAGQLTATIDVATLDDAVLESDETLTVTLVAITSGDANISIAAANSATVIIADDDSAHVTIAATDPTASEPANDGQFTVTQSAVSDSATTVSYTVSGTATAGNDFTPLAGSVTILAGQTSATIDLAVIDDSLLEESESVTVTLDSVSVGDPDISIGVASAATITIADDDTAEVTIAANDPAAGEPANNGQYTVTLSNISDRDTIISYTVSGDATSGTDFTPLTGTVTILAGDTTATIDLTTLDDSLLEDDETVTVTLDGITAGDADISIGAANAATITIDDDDSATVTIVANDATAAEPTDDGQFTVSMTHPSDVDTVLSYSVTGSATAGADYTTLSGSVTILAGDTSATIDLMVIDETLLESSESVVVTLDAIASGDADVTIGTTNVATITIADDDLAEVTIVANDATAAEPADNGQFTVSLSQASDTDTTISYVVSGDATPGIDYTALTGTVTILAGNTSATIDVDVLDEAILEAVESVTVTLSAITNGDADISIGVANAATVTISDDDVAQVTILANDAAASEPTDDGQFTLLLSSVSTTDTTISYLVSGPANPGTDYVALPGSATILAGDNSVTIDVAILDNLILESDETLTVTLDSITSGDPSIGIGLANAATITITDNDLAVVTIAASDATASEPTDGGQFTVTLSSVSDSDTTVSYLVAGDATSGSDFSPLTGSVTILAGASTATIDLNVIDDGQLEDDETVTVTLASISAGDADIAIGAANSDTITIGDDDTGLVSILATDNSASEPADGGQLTVSLSALSDSDTTVSYLVTGSAIAGSDYAALSGSILIPAGQANATIDVSLLDDATLEATESLVITLDSVTSGDAEITIDGSANSDSISIADDDSAVVSIIATDATAMEPTDPGQFTVSLSNPSDTDTTISYTVTGDATAGSDFTPLSGSVTILAGDTSALIDVPTLDDLLLEDAEQVTLTLNNVTAGDADIAIGTINAATVTLADNDSATVSIQATDSAASEPADAGQFTVTLATASDTDTTVGYTVTGDATAGNDYGTLSGTVTILAGTTTATIDVTTFDDGLLEDDESITVTLDAITAGDADISVDIANSVATVTLSDDDVAEVTISASDGSATEPADDGQLTVTLSAASDTDTVIAYSVAGDATSGLDFQTLTGTVTIPAGTTTATIDVATIDDSILEGDETVSVTLDSITSGDANIAIGAANVASVTIADNDTGTVSIIATDATMQEPANNGQFEIQLSDVTTTDTTVTYSVGGSASSGADFTPLSGSVTIAAGATSALIDVLVVNDAMLEGDETVELTLTAITSGDPDLSIDGSADMATSTIVDEDTAVAVVEANDAVASEPADNGQFTIRMTSTSASDVTFTYQIIPAPGSSLPVATPGSDYVPLTGTATILAGDTSVSINLNVLDDGILESDETVTIQLLGSDDPSILIDPGEATVTIRDDETALLSIAASDPLAAEPADDGQFTVTLAAAADTDTTVAYTVSGDASASDFAALAGTTTITAGNTSATIQLSVLDDFVLEDDESLTVTLTTITAGDTDIAIDALANSATITIADNDAAQVSIVATDNVAAEPTDDAIFTVSITNPSDSDTTVAYSISGDALPGVDFTPLSGSVTIAAGTTAAVIFVPVEDDNLLEDLETLTVTLDSITSGDADISIDATAATASVTIADNDNGAVSIAATIPTAGEPSSAGQFTVTMSHPADTDTIVGYSVSGTATAGADYTALSGSVTIPAGASSTTIDVNVLDDGLLEGVEEITVTLDTILSGDADLAVDTTANAATVTIQDDDAGTISIITTDMMAGEPGDAGQFTLTLSATSTTDTVIRYLVSGTATPGSDYAPLTGTVTIAAGDSSATIDVIIVDDGILESTEGMTIMLDAITSGDPDITIDVAQEMASLAIVDDDSATLAVSANQPNATEPGSNGQFLLTLSAPTDSDTVVTYAVGGTAMAGNDYLSLGGSITILAGETTATIDLQVIDDLILESSESVTISLVSITSGDAEIAIDPTVASGTIVDDDTAIASLTAIDAVAAEPANHGLVTVTLSAASDSDTEITYSIAGSATAGTDYQPRTGSVTVLAGSTSATIDLQVLDDNLLEPTETIEIRLTGTSNPAVSLDATAASATVSILDDDATVPPNVIVTSDSGSSNSDNITADNTPTFDVPPGTATPGDLVTIYADGTAVGSGTILPDGSFHITTSLIPDGDHDFHYTITDATGAESNPSPTLTVTIDTTAPTPPTVDPLNTNDDSPTITGTAMLDAGKVLIVEVDGIIYSTGDGNLSVHVDGTWSLSIPTANALPDGSYEVVATIIDLAGNRTTDTSSAELLIDTQAPSVDDQTTNDFTPLLTGQGTPGETLTISVDVDGDGIADATYTTHVASDGSWQIDPDTETPTSGTFPSLNDDDLISVTAKDIACNEDTGTIQIDVTTPVVDDAFTDDITPQLTGNGEPGETLTITVDADGDGIPEVTYVTTVHPDGTWSIDPDTEVAVAGSFPVVPGHTTLTVIAKDVACNEDMGTIEIIPPSGIIAGQVFVDVNENGILDPGETVLADIEIALHGTTATGQPVSLTTTTDAQGTYQFAGLYSGSYLVTQQQPDGFVDGAELPGPQGVITGDDQIAVTLTPGSAAHSVTFTERNLLAASVSKRWFLTSTHSGIYDDVPQRSGGSTFVAPSSGSTVASDRSTASTARRLDRAHQPNSTNPTDTQFAAAIRPTRWSRFSARSAFFGQSTSTQESPAIPIHSRASESATVKVRQTPSNRQSANRTALRSDRPQPATPRPTMPIEPEISPVTHSTQQYVGWRQWVWSHHDRDSVRDAEEEQ
jgi:hypothetical protein